MRSNDIFRTSQIPLTSAQEAAISGSFMSNVFSYMTAALGITAIIAYWFGTDTSLLSYLVSETRMTGLGYFVIFAPFGLVLLMGFGFQRMSSLTLLLLFIVYAALLGMSLSFIFIQYDLGTIYYTFGITGATFATMALIGYTTKTDLSKLGSILYMGLIGIIIAMVVNWFLGSSALDYVISLLGVLIFTGLTAYDVQKLKRIGAGVEHGTEAASKLALMGALTLYLDFINLFLFLLRLFGRRD